MIFRRIYMGGKAGVWLWAMLLLAAIGLPAANVSAQERVCNVSYDKNQFTFTWTAYKTPYKLPVSGSFDKYTITAKKSGGSVPDILNSAVIEIDGATVSTRNIGRDETIMRMFFMIFQPTTAIKATIENASDYDSVFDLHIEMNGMKSTIPMTYMVQRSGLFSATGYIDMVDVGLSKPFESLRKACEERKLHDGKTWRDVKLTMEIPVDIKCHNADPGEGPE